MSVTINANLASTHRLSQASKYSTELCIQRLLRMLQDYNIIR